MWKSVKIIAFIAIIEIACIQFVASSRDVPVAVKALKNAKSAEEKEYWRLCNSYSNSLKSEDKDKLTVIKNDLVAFGNAHKSSPFGARAFVVAGDIEMDNENYESARNLHRRAEEMLRKNDHWNIGNNYLPYVELRMGISYLKENKAEKAVEIWEKAYREFPNCSTSQQLPSLIRTGIESSLPPEKAWCKVLEFYDDAIKIGKYKHQLGFERVDLLIDATSNSYYPVNDLIVEIDKYLNSISQEDIKNNPLLKKHVNALNKVRKEFIEKSPLASQKL